MRIRSINSHLRPYRMVARRRTTIDHAFAAAIAPSDNYDEKMIGDAIKLLGQDPERDLQCAYCGETAETWDHVFATVQSSKFSGHGHRVGNLLPCCKDCNSRKGNKSWMQHLSCLKLSENEFEVRRSAINRYLAAHFVDDNIPDISPDLQRLEEIRLAVQSLLKEGDLVADRIRAAHADSRRRKS